MLAVLIGCSESWDKHKTVFLITAAAFMYKSDEFIQRLGQKVQPFRISVWNHPYQPKEKLGSSGNSLEHQHHQVLIMLICDI